MARFVAASTAENIRMLMFGEEQRDPVEDFLQKEIVRYIPQLAGRSDNEILDFVAYQKAVYLRGKLPQFGRPIASLNPTFVDSTRNIHFSTPDGRVYTRASVKENGYRMQLHIGYSNTAFTRQFTRFDLRMFPELNEALERLPVMFGDAELVNLVHEHLAGFNRVQKRIPNQNYWPKPGQNGLDEQELAAYLADPELFEDGKPLPDLELMLVFHGMFAIADPATWGQPRDVQMKNLISLCKLPIDYSRVDEALDRLKSFMAQCKNVRVVERLVVANHQQLDNYVAGNEERGLEGTCVVQSMWDKSGRPIVAPRSVKIKTYEPLDCSLLGIYLEKSELGLVEDNVRGALVGLYDETHRVYLAVTKVNLDPAGVQVKTEGQRSQLTNLRREIISLAQKAGDPDGKIYSLYDVFIMEGKRVMKYIFGESMSKELNLEDVVGNLPSRSDIVSLYEMFCAEKEDFRNGTAKLNTVPRRFISEHIEFFEAVDGLDKKSKNRFLKYFSWAKQIKATSAKLVRPQFVVDTTSPIIIETHVFDIKWGTSPYPAGFHSWYGNSFCLSNCFPKLVRYDKTTTTDYAAVHTLARMFTPKRGKRAT